MSRRPVGRPRNEVPSVKVCVTFSPDELSVIDRLASITGERRSKLIRQIIKESEPGLRAVLAAFDKAQEGGITGAALRAVLFSAAKVVDRSGSSSSDPNKALSEPSFV